MGFRNEIRSEILIDGTPQEVWAVLSDFAAYGEWNPGMERVEGAAEPGARLTVAFRLNGAEPCGCVPGS